MFWTLVLDLEYFALSIITGNHLVSQQILRPTRSLKILELAHSKNVVNLTG